MDALERQAMAEEKRIWLRLCRRCNNRCLFCHDSGCQDGSLEPESALRQAIAAGARAGGDRLILSGGEPSMHPKFLELVAYGRSQGFGWIQTVTNGRMFAYPDFSRRAVEAGLNEATFSMHGHQAALHDALVGVEGAFEQSLAGIRNLLDSGEVVVNIDVVLNAQNIDFLPKILEFFIGQGVYEFDLLHPVPFGRAWARREQILFPAEQAAPILRSAIEGAQSLGAILWTNRLPPAMLEGHEDLIQAPCKLHDEVRGRRAELEAWLDGEPLPCRQEERCAHCYLHDFCQALHDTLQSLRSEHLPAIRLSPDDRVPPAWLQGESPLRVDRLDVVAEDLEQAGRLAENLPFVPGAVCLLLARLGSEDPYKALRPGWPRAQRVGGQNTQVLETLVGRGAGPVWVMLDGESAAWMRRNSERVSRNAEATWLQMPRFSGMAALCQRGVQPGMALRPLGPLPFRLVNLPVCLLEGALGRLEDPTLPLATLDDAARLDLDAFTDHFLCDLHRCFSLRCEGCAIRAECRGLPVDMARAFGLSILRPREAKSQSD